MGPPTDAELIDASLTCPERFAEIFDRHAPTLLRYCTRRVGPHDAEDVLAETFRVAFTTRDRYDPTRASALPWLYGIAANLIRKQHRSAFRSVGALARLHVVDDGRTDVPFDETVADHDAHTRLLAAVARLVDELPAADREVLMLYAWEHLSYDEISEALGLPVGTVRSRLNRVRRTLRVLRDGDGSTTRREPRTTTGKEVVVPSERAPGGVT